MANDHFSRPARRGTRHAAVYSAVAAMVLAGLTALSPTTIANATDPSSAIADASHASDLGTAKTIAQRFGHDVIVDSESSETSLISARADGSMYASLSQQPAWASAGGTWVPEDTTLVDAGEGYVAPREAAAPVRFATDGSDTVATIQSDGGAWMTETWPYGNLPIPSITGSAATYAEVLPGIDLTLTARPAGMTQVFTVKTASAAANPLLADLRFDLPGVEVSTDEATDSITATAPSGAALGSASPMWWDSSSPHASVASPGDGEPQAVDFNTFGSSLSLDAQTAATGDVTYPVFVDPSWTPVASHTWYDDVAYPSQSYLDVATDRVGRGVENGITYVSRAFYSFTAPDMSGTVISSADFGLTQIYSNSCDTTPLQLWEYGPTTQLGMNWTDENQHSTYWKKNIDQKATNLGGCSNPSGRVGFDATQAVKDAQASGASTIQLGLRTQDESNVLTRKHFSNDQVKLGIAYNSTPNVPTTLSLLQPPRGCGTAASPVYVNDDGQSIKFQAKVTDPDAGPVHAQFAVYKASVLSSAIWTASTADASAQGIQTSIGVTSADLTGTTAFAWHVRANDGSLQSDWSSWCYFTVDNTPPTVPVVAWDNGSGPVNGTDGNPQNPVSAGATGTTVTVDVTSPSADHVALYEVWWTDDNGTNVPTAPPTTVSKNDALPDCSQSVGKYSFVCPATGSGTTLTTKFKVAPTDRNAATLWVAALDQAANVSVSSTQRPGSLTFNTLNSSNVDDNGVAYSNGTGVTKASGHGWLTTGDTVDPSTYPAGIIPDSNTTTPYNAPAAPGTTVFATTNVPQTGLDSAYTVSGALKMTGYVSFARSLNPATKDHAAAIEGRVSSSYNAQSVFGGLAPTANAAPTDTKKLYSCHLTNDEVMTSVASDCENQGVTGTFLGYIWKTSSDLNGTVIPLYRCKMAWTGTGSDHFDSTDSACEGYTYESLLGYLAPYSSTRTSNAVDTTKSFTVSAWIYPTDASGTTQNHTILSEAGTTDSGFMLQRTTDGRVRFCLRESASGDLTCATSAAALSSNTWSFVDGVWDAGNHRLIVQTGADSSHRDFAGYAVPSGDTGAVGQFMIGFAKNSSLTNNQFEGYIANPDVFQGVIDNVQLTHLFQFRATP